MRRFALGAMALAAGVTPGLAVGAPAASDASLSSNKPYFNAYYSRQSSGEAARSALPRRNGFASVFDRQLGAPTVLWADASAPAVGARPLAKLGEARARAYLRAQATALGIDDSIVDGAAMSDLQDKGHGPVIARFAQRFDGVEVFGRQLNVAMNQSGRLVAVTGYFAPRQAVQSTRSGRFDLGAGQAIVHAYADLGGRLDSSALRQQSDDGVYQTYAYTGDNGANYRLQRAPRVKKVYFPLPDRLVPAYYVELFAADRQAGRRDAYSYVISAEDGELLFRNNLTAEAAFTYRMFADADAVGHPYDEPLGNGYAPFTGSSYTDVIPRSGVPSQLVKLESSALISTGDPWLGPWATTTTGNNVDAYLDLSPLDGYTRGRRSNDLRPRTTSFRSFDYALAADVDPSTTTAQSSAVVNLFYMNNWLHDFWYDHGFDEAAGNAQTDNYSRGGVAGDAINAEGQDYSGRNNANMSTPADGGHPRMQMYLFDGLVNASFTVNSPASIAGSYDYGIAQFGAQTFDLSGNLVLAQDSAGSSSTDGCEALSNAAAVAGKIAVIDRGSCSFELKTLNAENAGAIATVIVNNVAGSPITMAEDSTVTATIPAMMVTLDDGNLLKATLAGSAVNVRMQRAAATDLDGTIDEGVIAHEFFHYVSNRLVNNANGLGNTQGGGMGEGWSDFDTMLLQVRPEDRSVPGNAAFQGAYPTGTYVTGEYYFGIRRAPYSTNFAINPLTFKHIQNGVALPTTAPLAFGQDGSNNAEVHNVGEVWANTLWEAYASLLNDPRYSFSAAQSRMQDYVIAGLKLTPASPTLLEARDGILAAAQATDCQDYVDIAGAFAKRGMGVNAVAPPRTSTTNAGLVEDFTAPSVSCTP